MRIADRFADGRPVFSFELFPPKKPEAVARRYETARELAALYPAFGSVTYGAGGSTGELTASATRGSRTRWRCAAIRRAGRSASSGRRAASATARSSRAPSRRATTSASGARETGITVPIVPGIMPVTNVAQLSPTGFVARYGATIPTSLRDLVQRTGDDEDAVRAIDVEWASDGCRLLAGGARGIHFYTLNRAYSARMVFENLYGTGTLARA